MTKPKGLWKGVIEYATGFYNTCMDLSKCVEFLVGNVGNRISCWGNLPISFGLVDFAKCTESVGLRISFLCLY